jgi:hypothetical protein
MTGDLFQHELISYGGYFKVHPATLKEWGYTYHPLPVDVELLHMVEWLKAHPRKAHKKNWQAFITGWLRREYAKLVHQQVSQRLQARVGAVAGRAQLSADDRDYYQKAGIITN